MKSIMYHYVQKDDPNFPFFNHLHVEDFKMQLEYFKKKFGFLTKENFLQSITTGNPSNGIVLTFDDGFKCHYRDVLPILEEMGLWGIFYVSTGVYETKKILDVHRIHILLGQGNSAGILEELKSIIKPEQLIDRERKDFTLKTYQIQKNDEDTNLIKRILNYYISYNYREGILDHLCQKFINPKFLSVEDFYISSEELLTMDSKGMIIGSHTVSHPVMSKLKKSEQEYEIRNSFQKLNYFGLSSSLKTFCYPYGGFHSFTPETESLLEKEGCLFSFNVESRDIEKHDLINRKQALPRYDCNEFPYGQVRRLSPLKS